ncbi:LCP family protein [Cutibacterium granulosum]|uniref:LCP family protein n=1 Tax=Cutibacterium granulosum TaxID=33011 RepID=UPI0023F9958B|nr:LCP family protein [Cutibacterium granulosum]
MTLLVLWIIWLVGVPAYALLEGQKVDATASGERPDPQPGTAVLLVGTDQRDNLTEKQQKQLGTGTAEGTRTDTMLLLYRPPKGRTILVSLPRDSYVPIPGHGRNKLNAAYAIGGAPLLTETVEQVTGVRLDGYMEIGFGGFVNMVDAVGGVDVCLDKPMKDRDSHTDLPAGCQNLDGISALGYVRMRKADPLGDLGRVKRQQEVASQVAHKAMSPWTFINPVRYWKVVNAGASTVRRGEDTSLGTTVVTARSLMGLSGPDGMKLTVPVANANAQTAAGSSVLWNRERALQLFEMMKTGDTSNADSFR